MSGLPYKTYKLPAKKPTPKFAKRIPHHRGMDDLERAMLSCGFNSPDKQKWLKGCNKDPDKRKEDPRFRYKLLDGLVVLTPGDFCYWWTVQQWNGSTCRWYVDFPLDVPVEDIVRFLGLTQCQPKES